MKQLILLLTLSALVLNCSDNPSEPAELLGVISGRVTDATSNEALGGARVTTAPSTSSKITDGSGLYTLPDVDPGTYVVTAEKDGYNTNSVSVNVEAGRTVSADLQLPAIQPTLGISTNLLNFGTGNTVLTFNISNVTQRGTLQWTITENADWLTASPNNGTATNELDQISVSVDRSGLNYGNHTTQLQISSNGGEVYLDILMTVSNPDAPQLTIDTQDLDFSDRETSKQFNITNTGTGDLIWSISEGYAWLDVTPNNGATTSETETVIVTVNRNNLDEDVYSANLGVTSNGGNISVNIRMEVSDDVIPPITLNDPTDVTETSMRLTWTRINHANFAFYRLYRSASPGVNENSTMIFESASSVDNSYTESGLSHSTTYYYKVFVVDLEGSDTGSNEVHSTTRTRVGSWSLVRSFDRTEFHNIDLISENSGFIAGTVNYGDANIKYFSGTNFVDEDIPIESGGLDCFAISVSCVSVDNVWATGYGQSNSRWLLNFNGTEWVRIERNPSHGSYSIHASQTGIVWIGTNSMILRYDGSEYQEFAGGGGASDFLYLREDDIYCVNGYGNIRYYDGFGWAEIGDVEGSLRAIDGISSDNLWVTGSHGIYHYNGIDWAHIDEVEGFDGYDIEVINESLIWVTGESSTIYRYDGSDWTEIENPLSGKINSIDFYNGVGWAVDQYGKIARYSE